MSADEPFDVRSLAATLPDGFRFGGHRHDWAQLVHARSGIMRVEANGLVWLVPSTRAIWIPPHTDHQIDMRGEVVFRTLYVAQARAAGVARGLGAMQVGPLLRELILHILAQQMLDPRTPAHDRLAGLLVDLINAAPEIDLMLPMPKDGRSLKLAQFLYAHPDDRQGLAALATQCGGSVRTMQRLFLAETGLSIDAWRQKARLINSAALLSDGASVSNTALDCGYDSASAYIAAFKRQFSMTPGQFAKA